MKLTQRLAKSQLKTNRSRTLWTLIGIALSTAMITAVFGFAASGDAMLRERAGDSEYYANLYSSMLISISAVFVSIIIVASVIVVSNSFRVSAGERSSQFGILKSVGATKKQITETIMYESIYLCLIGIPVGIVLGLLVNLTGLHIVDYFLAGVNDLGGEGAMPLVMEFVFAWQAIILAIVCSFVTVCLSAWLPARKAAKIAAIDAIRGASEVKVESKAVRASWIVKKIFGFEGMLASQSLKRSRRNFRATVVSLTVSVVLFIIVGSFGAMMMTMTTVFFPGIDVNVVAQFYTHNHSMRTEDDELIERRYSTLDSGLAEDVAERMREYPNTTVIGVGSDNSSYQSFIPREMISPRLLEFRSELLVPIEAGEDFIISLTVTDSETYALLCRLAGVQPGSNILINQMTGFYIGGGRSIFAPLEFSNQTLKMVSYYYDEEFELPLHGELTIGSIPGEILHMVSGIAVIVPQLETLSYMWFATTDDAAGFTDFANEVLYDSILLELGVSRMNVFNVDAEGAALQNTGRLIMIFIYGFIIMLTLIGLTNVISTISTNIRSRSREFAILQSVGMTRGGLRRILNLESILSSVKSLIIGIPIGLIAAYFIHGVLTEPVEFPFVIPWAPIIQCTLGVLAVTWITMQYSASRLRGGSIVEKIRMDSIA